MTCFTYDAELNSALGHTNMAESPTKKLVVINPDVRVRNALAVILRLSVNSDAVTWRDPTIQPGEPMPS